MPVLGQQMAEVAEPGLLLGSIALEPRLEIGRQFVRFTAVALPLEVPRAVALMRGPGLQQRVIDRELVGREQPAAATRPGVRTARRSTLPVAHRVTGATLPISPDLPPRANAVNRSEHAHMSSLCQAGD